MMLISSILFARLATSWDDVDWGQTTVCMILVAVVVIIVVSAIRSFREGNSENAKGQSQSGDDLSKLAPEIDEQELAKEEENQCTYVDGEHAKATANESMRPEHPVRKVSVMKCEYCENVVENPVGDACPFCGAPLDDKNTSASDVDHVTAALNENVGMDPAHTGSSSALSYYVLCKTCGCATSRESFRETGKCNWCGSENVYDNISSDFKRFIIRESNGVKVARCPECQCDCELDEVLSTRQCKWCNAELIPLVKSTGVKAADASSSIIRPSDTPQQAKIRELIAALRRENVFSGVDVTDYGFMPTPGEIVYEVVDDITLNESRSIRRSHTEKTGSSVYDYEGRSESKTHYEFQSVTNGNLFLTNKRIVFTGGQQVRNIKFDDIVSFESDWKRDEGAVQISSSKRAKAMRFTGADVFKFTLIYNAIRNPGFRSLFEKGPDDDLISKFVEIGLYYEPPTPPTSAPSQFDYSQYVSATEKKDSNGPGCLIAFVIGLILLIIIIANSS